MPLNSDELRFAIVDACSQEALTALTLSNDSKAMQILSLYSTLGLAAGGATLSGLSADPIIPLAAAAGFGTSALFIAAGRLSLFGCYIVRETPAGGRRRKLVAVVNLLIMRSSRASQIATSRDSKTNRSGITRQMQPAPSASWWLDVQHLIAPVGGLVVGVPAAVLF